MDNQHKLIKGYRDLRQDEIEFMNALKDLEEELGQALNTIEAANNLNDPEANRWVALARTHLETGIMFAIKAVARPAGGLGRRHVA